MEQAQDWFAANAPKIPPPAAPPAESKSAAPNTDWFAANAPKTPAPDAPESSNATSLHELSAQNPNSEGLYHMKDADGHSYAVPFSKVEMADDYRNSFVDEKEAERYEKDFKAKDPGLWAKTRSKVMEATEPTIIPMTDSHVANIMNATDEVKLNTIKRAGRFLFGTADFPVQYYSAAKKMMSDDPKESAEGESEIWAFHPGSQIAERIKEFKRDWKKDPKLAMANTAGDALGIYLTDRAVEVAKATPAKMIEKGTEAAREMTGTSRRSTEKLVRDTDSGNRDVAKDAEKVKARNGQIVAEAKTEAEKQHAAKVTEVRQANEKARAKAEASHAEKLGEVRRANQDAAEKHAAKVEDVVGHNNAVHETARLEHEEALGEVREKNDAAQRAAESHQKASEDAHVKKVKEVEEQNRKAAEEHAKTVEDAKVLEAKRDNVRRRTLELRSRIYDRLKTWQSAGKAYFDKQYDTIQEATKDVKAPLNKLVDAVYDAKAEEIEGSDTNLPIFKDILSRAKGETGGGIDAAMDGYDDLAPDEKAIVDRGGAGGVGQEISFKDLRGYDRELGKVIGSPGTASDMRQAAFRVQKSIRAMQQELADQAGVGSLNKKIGSQYKDYAQTFFDHAGPSASGSPIAQAVKAADAYNATKPFLDMEPEEASRVKRLVRGRDENSRWVEGVAPGEAGAKGTSWQQYRWNIGKLIEELGRLDREDKALPKPKTVAEPPEPSPAPEFKPLPRAPKPVTPIPEPVFEAPTLSGANKLKAIPEPPTPKPEPVFEPPEPKPEPEFKEPKPSLRDVPEPKTVTAEDAVQYKRERLHAAIDHLEKSRVLRGGVRIGGVGLAYGLAHLLGLGFGGEVAAGSAAALMSGMGMRMVADFLKKPWVEEGLTHLTKADMDALEKMPPGRREQTLDALTLLSREAKRRGIIAKNTPTPWVNVAKQDKKYPGKIFSAAVAEEDPAKDKEPQP